MLIIVATLRSNVIDMHVLKSIAIPNERRGRVAMPMLVPTQNFTSGEFCGAIEWKRSVPGKIKIYENNSKGIIILFVSINIFPKVNCAK